MAAHSVPGKPILPTSPSLPASSSQPPSDLAVGASPYDRMQADVKALQQQAQATQASLKKLQTQEAVDPVAAIVSEIPSMPEVDSALVGVGAVLLVALALVWWTLWRRPKAQWVDAQHSAADSSAVSELSADSAFAPQPMQAPEPNIGFDSEAAATEVIRVRKSLAEKREARFLLRESEEPTVPLSSPEPALDLDLELAPEPELPAEPQGHTADPWSMPGEGVHHDTAPSFDIDIHFTLPDAQDASDAPPEPEPEHEPEHEMKPTPDQILDAIELDFNLDEPAAVDTQPEPAANSPVGPDYATTLALAQVSEELEQLNEARDLAYEVLQSDDPALQSEARALLERLSEVESEMGPESVRWDDLR